MDLGRVLLIGAVLVVMIIAVWLVRRRASISTRKADPFGHGWQFYARPTELEPPGTIFRLTRSNVRYVVTTLELNTHTGGEAVGRFEESVSARVGALARFFGLDGPTLDMQSKRIESFEFKLAGATRQYVEDAEVDRVVGPWFRNLELRDGSRYYLIRECLSGRKVTYRFNEAQLDALGGEARIADAAVAEGTLHAAKRGSRYVLDQAFRRPLRVVFLAEELLAPNRSLGSEASSWRRPVSSPLLWEEP